MAPALLLLDARTLPVAAAMRVAGCLPAAAEQAPPRRLAFWRFRSRFGVSAGKSWRFLRFAFLHFAFAFAFKTH